MSNTSVRYIETSYIFKIPKRYSIQWFKEKFVEWLGFRLEQSISTGAIKLTPEETVRLENHVIENGCVSNGNKKIGGREIEYLGIHAITIDKNLGIEAYANNRIPFGQTLTIDDVPKFTYTKLGIDEQSSPKKAAGIK